jgi:hypothetical protein
LAFALGLIVERGTKEHGDRAGGNEGAAHEDAGTRHAAATRDIASDIALA